MGPRELGALMRQERRRRGLTQIELADLAEVSDRFVRDVEKGKPSAEVGRVMAVLEVLGLELVIVPRNPLAPREGLGSV